ncbi:hypothetical protein [Mastigocoleus testarum]|uniref:Uncharacterized protein n=1 Tax=Mastigocoleus testarum BC008 TaxID=371196 RepID=A0A0V7ZYE5_9CYAN|nr:hypothetical protein [Mastigocoleus testarum]KST61825.1 hypothetical protein BC008_07205 [Mastigocoleus testarum BC008]KST69612.1 hypothetical protein BC008_04735 [Mastigocoleus testarum BC008]
MPTPLPDWVKDWERQEMGTYLVTFDPNHFQWKQIETQGDSRGYIYVLNDLGFTEPTWVG